MAITTTSNWRKILYNAKSAMFGLTLIAATIPMFPAAQAQRIATAGTTHSNPQDKAAFRAEGSGTLLAMASSGKALGQCPLKHTDVKATISGYIARVRVKQTFQNTYKEKIEAIYTFPLSDSGAVDSMVMKVGDRTINGIIKKREEARRIYDEAKSHGHVASLLDQERTNIFTQSVANIEPGQSVEITLEYVDLMPYESGQFTFAFPTVVGPRFNPGQPQGKQGTGWAPDTAEVPDASKITPPVTPEGTRAGHDIEIAVDVDAGVKINSISSKLHDVTISRHGDNHAQISLKDKSTIPNKDFVLVWNVAGDQLKSGYLTYRDPAQDKSGYFTLMMLPPKRVTRDTVAPKEMIFLIDCSGSQSGAPLQKAKDAMNYILDHMNPNDTFQIVSFSSGQTVLFDHPEKVSDSMKTRAHEFVNALQANGGTWMAPAVEKVCSMPADANRLRIVTFMTDGFVGNDYEIIGMIKKLRDKSRWFPFGTGNSVNRNLIDNIAHEGGGEAEYVLLNSNAEDVGSKFYKRIQSPVLTDVKIDFGGMEVKEVFPKELNDVWAEKPLYFEGRYLKPADGTVTISGFAAGKPYQQTMHVNFPEQNAANNAIGSIWARAKVDRLMGEDWFGAQKGESKPELKEEIIKTALDHHIMTQYTSFVAVEDTKTTKGGAPTTVTVPVEMPDGVSREGVFGKEKQQYRHMATAKPQPNRNFPTGGKLMYAAPQQLQIAQQQQPVILDARMSGNYFSAGSQNGNSAMVRGGIPSSRLRSAGSGGGGGFAIASPMPAPSAPGTLAHAYGAASEKNGSPTPTGTKSTFAAEPAKTEVSEHALKVADAGLASKSGNKKDGDEEATAKNDSSKLAAVLQKLINGTISAEERKTLHMQKGSVSIKVTCFSASPELEKALAKAGFKLVRSLKKGVFVGLIDVSKLKALSEMKSIVSIEPST